MGRAVAAARRLDVSPRRWIAVVALGFAGGMAQATLLGLLVALAFSLEGSGQDVGLPLIGDDINEIAVFAAALGMAIVLMVVEITAARIITSTAGSLTARRRARVTRAFFGASWESQSAEKEGSLQDLLISHVGQVTAGFTALAQGTVSLAVLTALVSSAFFVSPLSALILVVVTGSLFMVLRPVTSAVHRRNRVLSAAVRGYAQDTAEVSGLTMELRTLGVADVFEAEQIDKTNDLARLFRRARFVERLGATLFRNLTLFVVLGVMGVLYGLDVGSAPTLGLSLVLLLRSASFSQNIQNAVMQAGAIHPYLERLEQFEERMETTRHRTGSQPVDHIDELVVADVSFAYGDDNVLDEVSFAIGRGECIGIIGPSGSGKSTLAELLLRLREPARGELSINGHDSKDVADSSWYGQIGYVAQTPRLITGTVVDNVRFGRELTDGEVVAAIRRAGLEADVATWPDGIETAIGSRSTGVSGGQRQRIALARALAAGPSFLLLDEPTSSLDASAEQLVVDTLRELKGTVTMVIVTHRAAALAPCDRLIEIDRGRITYDGPADQRRAELLELNDRISPARAT